jgi:hypothetical protein
MKGIVLAQQAHAISILAPVDITGGKTGRWASLANYGHITFFIPVGVSAAAWTKIIVLGANSAAGAGATAIAFDLYTSETTTVDLLASRQRIAAAGYTPSAVDDIFYVIELDASDVVAQLGETFQYVTVQLTNGVNSVIAAIFGVLSGSRYAGDASPSVNV